MLARRVELVEAHEQEAGQVLGQAGTAEGGRGDQLLGEERVALGPLDHLAHLRLGERLGLEPADQLADGAIGERGEVEALDLGQPGPVGEGGPQRVAAVQVVAAVGRDDAHPA